MRQGLNCREWRIIPNPSTGLECIELLLLQMEYLFELIGKWTLLAVQIRRKPKLTQPELPSACMDGGQSEGGGC